MKKTANLILSGLLLTACATPPTPNSYKTNDPAVKAAEMRSYQAKRQLRQDAAFIPKVMLDMDKALDKYFEARRLEPNKRAKATRLALDKIIREQTRKFFDVLVAKADDPENPEDRGIALVALGFVDEPEDGRPDPRRKDRKTDAQRAAAERETRRCKEVALNSLVTALSDPDKTTVEKAVAGLGILGSNDTPIEEIGRLMEDTGNTRSLRKGASWTLVTTQPKLMPRKRERLRPIYQRVLLQPLGDVEPEIVIHCIAGLGRLRHPEDASAVAPYCQHPTPLIRARAAVALGLMRNQESYPKLIELIKPVETNQTVRLAARKALMALAGGKDRRYDVREWKLLFTRK